jgi:hypothetical protein
MRKPKPKTWPYFYKFLNADLSCTYGRGSWVEGEWMPMIAGALESCANGYHCLTPRALIDWIAPALWRVEVRGGWIWKEEGKVIVVREARLHSRVEQWDERNQRLLAAEFGQWAVDRHWRPHKDSRPQQAIDAARAYARGEIDAAAMDAARAAAKTAWRAACAAAWPADPAAWTAGAAAAADAAAAAARAAAWPADTAAWAAYAALAADAALWAARDATGAPSWAAARAELNQIMIDWLVAHTARAEDQS